MSVPPFYLIHPAAVHFPIALLTVGVAVELFYLWRQRKPVWLRSAVSWLLWLGTASAWVAMWLGLLAEDTAPHVPMAWEELAEHKALAFWAVGLFTALSIWRYEEGDHWDRYFAAAWLICIGILLAAAFHGGILVFNYGMGVQP